MLCTVIIHSVPAQLRNSFRVSYSQNDSFSKYVNHFLHNQIIYIGTSTPIHLLPLERTMHFENDQ